MIFALLAAFALLPLSAQQAPKKVLVIGDSHLGTPFGAQLDKDLRDRFGPTVATYGVGATNIHWWVSKNRYAIPNGHYFFRGFNEPPTSTKDGYVAPPDIDVLMSTPWDIVVVALGSNPDQPSLDASVTAGMLLLTKMPKDARCFWVGPPPMPCYGTHTDDLYPVFPQMFSQGGHACKLIDSRNFVTSAQSRGCHFWGPESSAWADGVFKIIAP